MTVKLKQQKNKRLVVLRSIYETLKANPEEREIYFHSTDVAEATGMSSKQIGKILGSLSGKEPIEAIPGKKINLDYEESHPSYIWIVKRID